MAKAHANNMFINLVSDTPANAGKALRFGRKFLAANWQVVLSLNIEGVRLIDPDAVGENCPVAGVPLKKMLRAFIAEGGHVLVGKECLGLAGIPESALQEGMWVATFSVLEEVMSRENLRIITW